MTILVFVVSLLAAMAIGIPISFALLVCGAALMWQLGCSIRRSWRRT